MSPFCQDTDVDHEGAVGDEVTADQLGSPERLQQLSAGPIDSVRVGGRTILRLRPIPDSRQLYRCGFLGAHVSSLLC
jgi:hypothetical protein